MIEFDDIQHILLTRAPALTGRYEFLSFRDPAGGRAWLSAIKDTVHSAAAMRANVDKDKRWVTIAFTWNGLRALGLEEASLSSFPEEFKQGMAARAEALGDSGVNAPENWVGKLASPEMHAIAILFARDEAERVRCVGEHDKLVAASNGVEVLSVLDLNANPTFRSRTRSFWISGSPLTAGHRRQRGGANPRLRRAVESRRVHSGLSRRARRDGGSPAAEDARAQWQLHGLSPAAGACWPLSGLSPTEC